MLGLRSTNAPDRRFGNRAKRVPFCRIASKRFALAVLLAIGALSASASAQEPQQGANFLKLSEGQRYWWVHGAITTSSHLISMTDKKKGECVSKWYLSDRDAKQKLIEATITKYPAQGPTTIVLSLIQQACGKLGH